MGIILVKVSMWIYSITKLQYAFWYWIYLACLYQHGFHNCIKDFVCMIWQPWPTRACGRKQLISARKRFWVTKNIILCMCKKTLTFLLSNGSKYITPHSGRKYLFNNVYLLIFIQKDIKMWGEMSSDLLHD